MITGSRCFFVGFHVTSQVRRRLREEAERLGVSVSSFVYNLVLRALGMER